MREGWISLHRKLRDSVIYTNSELLHLWIHFLLKASHKEHEQMVGNQKVILKPGEFVFGRKSVANELNIHESKFRRLLKVLEAENCLVIKSTNKFSIGTIVNWELYQVDDIKTTNKRPTNDQQTTTNNNDNNVNKKTYSDDFDLFWNEYPRKKEKPGAFKNWNTRLKEKHKPQDLILAAKNYAKEVAGKEIQYIKLPTTFLGPSKPFEDYIKTEEVKQKTERQLTDDEQRMEELFKKKYGRGEAS